MLPNFTGGSASSRFPACLVAHAAWLTELGEQKGNGLGPLYTRHCRSKVGRCSLMSPAKLALIVGQRRCPRGVRGRGRAPTLWAHSQQGVHATGPMAESLTKRPHQST
jgi:hypothetical protein